MKEKHWFMNMIPVQKAVFWLIAVFMVGGVLFSLSFTLQKDDDSGNSVIQVANLQANRVNGLKQRYRSHDAIVEEHQLSASLCHFSKKLSLIYLDLAGTIKPHQINNVLRL